MTQFTSSVAIDFEIYNAERMWDYDNGGGVRITLAGNRLNKYVDESEWEPAKGHKEYSGTHLFGDLYDILETTADIVSNPVVYEVSEMQFDGYNDYLELEYLGRDTLRIAYRVRIDNQSDAASSVFYPDPVSACGYPVDLDAWAEAVRSAVEEFQAELRANGEPEQADWFDAELATVTTYLDS